MDITTYLIMAAALAGGALVKGATGMGLPLVALPVLTAFFGLQHAISVMIVPILFTNVAQVWKFRAVGAESRVRFVPALMVGGVLGVALGTWLLVSQPERYLMLGLGALLLVYVVLRITNPAFVVGETLARRAALPVGIGGGLLQGATGISAPIGVTFIHAMRLDRDAHVFAVSAMFLGFGAVQFVALIVSGVMQTEWLVQGVLALVPIFAFMPVGQWLAGKLSAKAFDRLILAFLGVIGLKLVLGI